MSNSKKKYTLFAQSGDGKRAPCAFFNSASGCRNGDSCKFSHEIVSKITDETSMVSSESSEGEIAIKKEMTSSERKRSRRSKDSDPFAKPKKAKTAPPKEDGKAPQKSAGKQPTVDDFRSMKLPVSSFSVAQESKDSPPERNETAESQPQAQARSKRDAEFTKTVDFRSLDLPIVTFSVMPKKDDEEKSEEKPKEQSTTSVVKEEMDVEKPLPTILPKSTAVGRNWLDLVSKTRAHARYSQRYNFDRFMQQDEENGLGGKATWIKAKPFGEWCASNPQAIALDCEMVETQDPVSGKKDSRSLCRLSIVDAETQETLLDTLVKPAWPVSDYRTWIHGIGPEQLDRVQFTLRHAQAFLMALCSEETVMIGHSIENDLAALHMEHYCIADSACLFRVKGSERTTPGLKDLTRALLGTSMPKKHDSVNDAIMALKCILHYREKEGKVEPIERERDETLGKAGSTLKPKRENNAGNQLFVHRIPKSITDSEILSNMFENQTDVTPSQVNDIEFSGDFGRTFATFRSTAHANLAFDSLEGKADIEASGRPQKKVFLRNGGYIRVRKNIVVEKSPSTAARK